MRKLKVLGAFAAALLVLLTAGQVLAQGNDAIIIKIAGKESRLDGIILGKESWDSVRYKISSGGSRWQEEPTDNVVEVIHGDQPQKFQNAEKYRKNGNWKSAIQEYNSCIKHERKEWVKIYAQFYKAECLRMWGQTESSHLDEAIKEYEVFKSKYSDHRFIPQSLYGMGHAARAAGNAGKAKNAFDNLGSGKYGQVWQVRGQYYSNIVTGGSVASLEKLISQARRLGMNDIVAAARLGLAETLLRNRKYREAKKMFEDIVKDPEGVGKEVLAAAHNGLGDCYAKLASREDDKKKALFEYLKVVTLYAGAHEQYISALQKAIDLLNEIGGDVYKSRIADLQKELANAKR